MTTASARLSALGLSLPAVQSPLASYVPARRSGQLLFLSGHVCRADGAVVAGVVGDDVDVDRARELARTVALDLLASATTVAGSLDAIAGVIQVTAYVRSAAGFHAQPAVIDAASQLFADVFGDAGRHARSAVGVSALPLGAALEIAATLELL